MTLTNYQYDLFTNYTLYKALECNDMAEVLRKLLIKELGNG